MTYFGADFEKLNIELNSQTRPQETDGNQVTKRKVFEHPVLYSTPLKKEAEPVWLCFCCDEQSSILT
jgi:hypothetical protein